MRLPYVSSLPYPLFHLSDMCFTQIGTHTFQLHEIYGLSSSSSSDSPALPTTYPPTSTPSSDPSTPQDPSRAEPIGHDADHHALSHSSSGGGAGECIICLASPRDTLLLPCRHLVACAECALSMAEFGAAGRVPVAGEEVASPPLTGGPQLGEAGTAVQSPVVIAPARQRKRNGKGWFCPICRQRMSLFLTASMMND